MRARAGGSSSSSNGKGDEGFGEDNFKALFESLERGQIQRVLLKAEASSDTITMPHSSNCVSAPRHGRRPERPLSGGPRSVRDAAHCRSPSCAARRTANALKKSCRSWGRGGTSPVIRVAKAAGEGGIEAARGPHGYQRHDRGLHPLPPSPIQPDAVASAQWTPWTKHFRSHAAAQVCIDRSRRGGNIGIPRVGFVRVRDDCCFTQSVRNALKKRPAHRRALFCRSFYNHLGYCDSQTT